MPLNWLMFLVSRWAGLQSGLAILCVEARVSVVPPEYTNLSGPKPFQFNADYLTETSKGGTNVRSSRIGLPHHKHPVAVASKSL